MTMTIKQGFARPSSIGENASATIDYYVFGESDEVTAHAGALAQFTSDFPSGYRSMPLRTTSIEKIGVDAFKCPFQVGLTQNQAQPSNIPNPSDPDDPLNEFNTTMSFNLVGGTTHITNSLAVINTYTASGFTAMDFKGAIGVEFSAGGSQTRVRGLDIFTPILDYTYTTQFANDVVTDSYIDTIFALTGQVNNATFKGRPAGSVLFKGARGSRKGQDRWEIGFEFAYSENKTGLTIGDITGIDKKGWEYLDILYMPAASRVNGLDVSVPQQVTIHKVYETGNFKNLLIGV